MRVEIFRFCKELLRDQARVKAELGEVEELWLEASESLHQAEKGDGEGAGPESGMTV
jgi:hypothetical protein